MTRSECYVQKERSSPVKNARLRLQKERSSPVKNARLRLRAQVCPHGLRRPRPVLRNDALPATNCLYIRQGPHAASSAGTLLCRSADPGWKPEAREMYRNRPNLFSGERAAIPRFRLVGNHLSATHHSGVQPLPYRSSYHSVYAKKYHLLGCHHVVWSAYCPELPASHQVTVEESPPGNRFLRRSGSASALTAANEWNRRDIGICGRLRAAVP